VISKNENPNSSKEVNTNFLKYENDTQKKKKKFKNYKYMKKENQFNKDKIDNKIDNNKYHDNKNDNNESKNNINNNYNIINNSFKQESLKDINNQVNTEKKNKDNIKDNLKTINNNTYKSEISIINNIKSLYIFKLIFEYIDDKDFPYILFNYNKLNQKKFELFLDSYKTKYEEKMELQNIKTIYLDSPLFKEKIANNTIYILLRNNN